MTDLMYELEGILQLHAQRYPLMQPQDAVKLIYQNEFGGGHLIRDEETCKHYLYQEYSKVQHDPEMPLYEEIGNGIVRVNLAALDKSRIGKLAEDFIRSAGEHRGSTEAFQKKLEVLRKLTMQGGLPFSPAALEAYLAEYRTAGYPMISHSQEYRDAYHPAYRVIRKQYL